MMQRRACCVNRNGIQRTGYQGQNPPQVKTVRLRDRGAERAQLRAGVAGGGVVLSYRHFRQIGRQPVQNGVNLMKQQYTVLVVDDEPTIREVVRRYLERDGYRVQEAADGSTALRLLREQTPDLVVLDIMLPGVDGFSITRRLRDSDSQGLLMTEREVPIIILTARTGEHDRIQGLELGADDYVTKPFSPQELVARVRAVLRRTHAAGQTTERPLEFEHLRIDPRTREVTVRQQPVMLTAKEFDLLWFFASHPRQVFNRDQLLDQVWGYSFYGDPSTVTVHVRRLREKIEPDPASPVFIQTVWGVGYKFDA